MREAFIHELARALARDRHHMDKVNSAIVEAQIPTARRLLLANPNLRTEVLLLRGALKRVTEELKAAIEFEDCEHQIGVCYCNARRALESAETILGAKDE